MSAGWQISIQICIIQRHTSITSSYSSFLTAKLIKVNIIFKYHKGYWYVYLLNNNKNPTHFDPSSALKIGTRRILVIVEFIARL